MTKPVWIDERDTLTLHELLLALHGGAPGVRDAGLLKSAVARPRQLQAYGDAPDLIDLAAAWRPSSWRRFSTASMSPSADDSDSNGEVETGYSRY